MIPRIKSSLVYTDQVLWEGEARRREGKEEEEEGEEEREGKEKREVGKIER